MNSSVIDLMDFIESTIIWVMYKSMCKQKIRQKKKTKYPQFTRHKHTKRGDFVLTDTNHIQKELGRQIEELVRDFVKEKLEMILREEIKNFLENGEKEVKSILLCKFPFENNMDLMT